MQKESQPGVFISLANFVKRDIERTAARGLRPEEVARERRWKKEATIRRQIEALEAETAGQA